MYTYEKNGILYDEINQQNSAKKIIQTFDKQGIENLRVKLLAEIEKWKDKCKPLSARVAKIEEVLK